MLVSFALISSLSVECFKYHAKLFFQGSYLGLFLFLIYINDMPHHVGSSVIATDDTTLCYQSPDINILNDAINNDLIQLDNWLKGNKLSLNVAKTNSILASTKQSIRAIRLLWSDEVEHV